MFSSEKGTYGGSILLVMMMMMMLMKYVRRTGHRTN